MQNTYEASDDRLDAEIKQRLERELQSDEADAAHEEAFVDATPEADDPGDSESDFDTDNIFEEI